MYEQPRRDLRREPAGRMPGKNVVVTSLGKRTQNGEPYTRNPEIEALLVELSSLSRAELIARAVTSRQEDPCYIPSECLIYFIRASKGNNEETWFEQLYKILLERVLRSLPKAEGAGGKTESFTAGVIREKVYARFVTLLAEDRIAYSEKLDYFEVRFDGALASLRRDARRQAWRDEKRTVSLEYDNDTGEPSAEVERAAGHFAPFAASKIDDAAYRLRLDAAIDSLPSGQRRIIEMLRLGIRIDSKDPDAVTISKALKRSEKTVRTHRDKAFATLRALLEGEKR